jgi:dihydrofolate synthase/folylpolyglutamate synthase
MATAITSIGIDHQRYLGETLREIAVEKAGIVKAGVPLVVGRVPPEAREAIAAVACERRAQVIDAWAGVTVDEGPPLRLRTPAHDYGEVRPALAGAHQLDNAVTAVRLLETMSARGVAVTARETVEGLARVVWPGRLDLRSLPDGREALLDAAHNVDGARALAAYLAAAAPRPLVFAAMRDKDAAGMLRALAPSIAGLIVTRASNRRSAEPADLAALAREAAPALPLDVAATPAEALALAWRQSARITVAGSIFLLGDVIRELGGS